jgi:glycosyltransferase involved in cell wall biosynthesis
MTARPVSIVVTTLNRLSTLPTTLRALEALRWPNFEVVVVNGPGEDDTEVYLELYWKDRLRVIECPGSDLALSRTVGLQNAAGEIVVFLDIHAVPEPDWLDHLIAPYDDPSVGAVSFCGSFSIRKMVADKIGRLDDGLASVSAETDFAPRVQSAGYQVRVVPEAGTHHLHPLEGVERNPTSATFEGVERRRSAPPPPKFLPLPTRPASGRLRLAFVTSTYFPRRIGGIAVFMSELARQLAEEGHEITIITRAEKGTRRSVDYEDGIWVHRLPVDAEQADPPAEFPNLPHGPARFALQVLAELDRVNGHRNFSAVIGTIWNLDLAGMIASRRYRVAMYLVTSYLLMLESKPEWGPDTDHYKNHVLKMVDGERWALRAVDRLYASTAAILNDIRSTYALETDQLAPTVQIPFGLPDYARLPHRRSNRDVRITFVGRLERRKGIDLLLDAIPTVMARHGDVSFRIVGEDFEDPVLGTTHTARFRSRHAHAPWLERVEFTGYVDDEMLRSAFEDCDIFVAPSRYESFGLIYLEAMRAGKPSVGVGVGGVTEVVEDGVTGRLVEPTSAAIAEALSALTSNADMRHAMGKAARRRFEEKFSLPIFADRFTKDVASWLGTSLG